MENLFHFDRRHHGNLYEQKKNSGGKLLITVKEANIYYYKEKSINVYVEIQTNEGQKTFKTGIT